MFYIALLETWDSQLNNIQYGMTYALSLFEYSF